jgi:hypothetical protein
MKKPEAKNPVTRLQKFSLFAGIFKQYKGARN